MKKRVVVQIILLGIVMLLFDSTVFGATLQIGPNEDVTFGVPKTRYWSLNASAFIPDNGAFWARNEWMMYATAPSHFLSAPVHLPDGATIVQMDMTSYDEGAARFNATLYRVAVNVTANLDALITVPSTTSHGSILWVNSSGPVSHAIDNSAYTYYIVVSGFNGTNTHQLSAVTLKYTVDRPLP